LEWVRDGGTNDPGNLLALCGHCHDQHTYGHIPAEALAVWKGALVALNSPNRGAADVLLQLERMGSTGVLDFAVFTAGDVLSLAPLIGAGLVEADPSSAGSGFGEQPPFAAFRVLLTDRGETFVKAWLSGSRAKLEAAVTAPVREARKRIDSAIPRRGPNL
jgi:hypothetical protein